MIQEQVIQSKEHYLFIDVQEFVQQTDGEQCPEQRQELGQDSRV